MEKNGMTELKTHLKPLTGKKNAQLVTCGIFYCRDSTDFSVSASNKFSCSLTGQCSEIGNKNIPLSVRANARKKDTQTDFGNNDIF